LRVGVRSSGVTRRLPPLALAFHGVAEVPFAQDPGGLFVRPELLVRHIGKLRSWGYRLVTFGELAAAVSRGQGTALAALTFDDGFADNAETLAPLLEREGVPATVFVVAGWLGRRHPSAPWARIMTVDELRRVRAANVEIGAHSVTHADLGSLAYPEARAELEGSKRMLEQVLGEPVDVAAYPFGSATEETLRACRDAGFRAACRIAGEGSWTDPWSLPRQSVLNGSTLLSLRLKRGNHYERVMHLPPARVWRRLVRDWRTVRAR
jgi:peptidoglycan/xylan/chitin deacetylase (PgdA/CDA1 family)